MIVGLLFIAIIWCLRGFLSYKQVVHNSCNMSTCGLPDIYTLSPRACGPRALGVYIRQTTRAPVTTIQYITKLFVSHMISWLCKATKGI